MEPKAVKQDYTQLVQDLKELRLTFMSCDEPSWIAARKHIEALLGFMVIVTPVVELRISSVRHVDGGDV